jgi:hypothetical protein
MEGWYYFHSPSMKKSAQRPELGSNSEPDKYKSTVHQVPIFGHCNDTNVGTEKFVSRSALYIVVLKPMRCTNLVLLYEYIMMQGPLNVKFECQNLTDSSILTSYLQIELKT